MKRHKKIGTMYILMRTLFQDEINPTKRFERLVGLVNQTNFDFT